eukprot:COSAG02_NODE_997_length_15333_cov_13.688526_10_plen_135_part_00
MADSSYTSKHVQKTRYETSRMRSMLLEEAARLEAEAWALQKQERESLERTSLYWTEQFERQAVQSENHRLAEKVVDLTDTLVRERADAAREIERVRSKLQHAEDDARIARVSSKLHQRDGTYDTADASRSLLWR